MGRPRKERAATVAGPAAAITEELMAKWPLTKPPHPQSKLNAEVAAAICEGVALGNYPATAAAAAGIGKTTFEGWLQKGEREPDSVYAEFAALVETARAQAESENVAVIKRAAPRTWTAAAWLLERQYPERWGQRNRLLGTGDNGDFRVTFVFDERKPAKAQLDVIDAEPAPVALLGVEDGD